MSAGRRGTWIVLVGLIGLAVAASPAAAAKKKSSKPGSVKTATATVNTTVDHERVSAVATCPGKTKVVGGGFALGILDEGNANAFDNNQILESRREGDKAWRVTAFRVDEPSNLGGPAGPALPVTSEAYCRSKPGKITEVATTETGSAASGLAIFDPAAACGLGKAVLGGGFSLIQANDDFYNHILTANRPLGNVGWSVSSGGSFPVSSGATAFAYCRKLAKPLRQTSASGPMPPPDGGSVSAVDTPACPGKRTALAGGFEGLHRFGPNGVPSWVESRRTGKSWHVSTANLFNQGPPGSFTAFALCG